MLNLGQDPAGDAGTALLSHKKGWACFPSRQANLPHPHGAAPRLLMRRDTLLTCHTAALAMVTMLPVAPLVLGWRRLLLRANFGGSPDLSIPGAVRHPGNPRQSAKRSAFGSICKNSPAINLSSSIWGAHNFLHSDKLLFISNVPEGNWPIAYFHCQCHYAEPGSKTQIQPGDFSEWDAHKTGHYDRGPAQRAWGR